MERIFTGGVNGAIMGDMLTTIGNTIKEDKEMIERLGIEFSSLPSLSSLSTIRDENDENDENDDNEKN